MNWIETWAKMKVIGGWVILGIFATIALVIIFKLSVYGIKQTYKRHSKKYVWSPSKGDYVKKEDEELK